MGTFLEQALLAENSDFLKRVKIAVKKTASAIVGEVIDENKLILAEKRHKLGYHILNGDMTELFAEAIVSANTSISENSTDSDLEFMSATVFNDIAGVKITEQ